MTSLWFVTPAWKRYALSEVCFEQRRRVIAVLAEHGIEGRCVVVADDDNLDIARSKGFDTVERNNDWLGRKFNDGMEYAGRHGADFIVPIGSDSWIDPAFFLPLATDGSVLTSGLYAVAEADRLAELRVSTTSGAGPYVFPRALLTRSNFRPADDQLSRGIDSSTIKGIERRRQIRWQHRDLHALQYVGLRGLPRINSYDALRDRWGVSEYLDPWRRLAQHYGQDLADEARKAIGPGATEVPNRRRVLILSMGEDTNGNGWRIRAGLQNHTDLHVDAAFLKRSRQRHPEQVTGSKHKRRQITEKLYDSADAVHLFNSLDGWQELDQRDSRRRCKPILVHHHGVGFRREHAIMAQGARNIGALQVASTIDLTLLEPDVQWLPAMYDLAELAAIRERHYTAHKPLRVVHAPTFRSIKGTEHVLAAMKDLPGVDFDLIENASWSDCLRRLAQADIVVDQFRFGVGSLAVEAWAMGIPVVAGIEDLAVRAEMLRRWKRLPFVEADPATLPAVLSRLIASGDARKAAAARGLAHVRRWHDEPKVVAQLMDLYDRLQPSRYPVSAWRGVKPWRKGKLAGSMYRITRQDSAA